MNAALDVRCDLQCQLNCLMQQIQSESQMLPTVPSDQQAYRNLNGELIQFKARKARVLGLCCGFPDSRCIHYGVGQERLMFGLGQLSIDNGLPRQSAFSYLFRLPTKRSYLVRSAILKGPESPSDWWTKLEKCYEC